MNGSIIIPEKFQLNKRLIKVLVDDSFCEDNNCFGEADFTEKCITLCDKYFGKKVSKKEKEKVFYHELVHMILDSMHRHNLKYNEDFVEDFSQRLYEYEKTKV